MARPPLALDRLALRDDGRVVYRFKKAWRDGTNAVVLSPQDFIARSCALVPPPRFHLMRYLGARSASRVVMESCAQSPAIASASNAAGHSTVVVPGSVVRALGVRGRGIKTDDRDAEVLARVAAAARGQQVHRRRRSLAARIPQ
jgi:hypothetical protein